MPAAASASAAAGPKPEGDLPISAAAVLNQADLPVQGGASSPDRIAAILRAAGIQTQLISADELADAAVLAPTRFNLVVLPYSAAFPVAARDTMVGYLRKGGNLITTGGYAFDHLFRRSGGQWVREDEYLRAELARATGADRSILPNGGFEQPQEMAVGGSSADGRWYRTGEHCRIVAEGVEGRHAAACDLSEGSSGGASAWLDVEARPGRTFQISGWMRTSDIAGRGMAFMAIYQYDAAGRLVEFRDFATAKGTTPWQRYEHVFTVQPRTARLRIPLGLYEAHGTAWFDDIRLCDITGLQFRPMNTSSGRPEDGLRVSPDQIGMFDASFPLKRACGLRTAADQFIIRESVSLQRELRGWAASGVVGYDNARWIPLLETFDRYGRPRGAAGAMLLHYNGPFAGSAWAYFGVENVDLFADVTGEMARVLQQTARFMAIRTYLHSLATDHRRYKPEEAVKASVMVTNRGMRPRRGVVEFTVSTPGGSAPVAAATRQVMIAPGQSARVEVEFARLDLPSNLGQLSATLRLDGEPGDRMHSGFVMERAEVAGRGAELRFAGNYFTLDGRPMFLFGSDTYSVLYHAACENPLTWSQEIAAARDIGMNLYEILQYTKPAHRMDEEDWHAFGALNQLVQQHRMVFMPGMLVGHNVAIGEKALAEESALCAGYARRFGRSAGLLWYINGDYVLDAHRDLQATRELWNQWLQSRYGSTGELRSVWGDAAVKGELGNLDYPPPNSARWDDAAAVDGFDFENWLTSRWNKSHVAAIRRHDAAHPITSEYYSSPSGGLDLVQTIDGQDVSNIGFFDRPESELRNLPLRICFNDLRLRGKGVSLGEYGVKTHPAWTVANGGSDYHITRSEEDQQRLFMAVAHYALGLGACKVQNWCLRDDPTAVFPWGLFYPNQLIPKDVAFTHRNQSMIWRYFEPIFQPQALAVCLPNRLRVGNDQALGIEVAGRAFEGLLGLHYRFNVIDDDHLDQLPPAVRAMILPSPMAMSDKAFSQLLAWVGNGGTLLVSGDFSRDSHRQPTRRDRLGKLAGVESVAANYIPNKRAQAPEVEVDFQTIGLGKVRLRPCIRIRPAGCMVLGKTADDVPVLVQNSVGKGNVFFLTDPIEMADDEATRIVRHQLYRALLEAGNPSRDRALLPLQVWPDEPWLHVLDQPTARGRVHILYNTRSSPGEAQVRLATGAGELSLAMRNGWPALAAVSGDGKVLALNASGQAAIDGQKVFGGAGLKALLSLDGQDLRRSQAILVAPFQTGRLVVPQGAGLDHACIGEHRDGRWITLERVALDSASRQIEIDADRATCLILICRRQDEARWIGSLTEAMLNPQGLGGY